MVVVLDRPRHEEGIEEIRKAGGRVRLITDGDVAGALLAVSPRTPATLLWGIGGTPEGVISAAGVKCMGGAMVGRLWPRDDDERKAAEEAGYDVDARAHPGRPRQGRRRVLLRHRRDRRRRAPGRALPRARAAPRPSRWSCARARARSAGSCRVHDRDKLRSLTGYAGS